MPQTCYVDRRRGAACATNHAAIEEGQQQGRWLRLDEDGKLNVPWNQAMFWLK